MLDCEQFRPLDLEQPYYNEGPQGSLPGTTPRVSTLRLQRRASRFFAGYHPPCVYPPSTTKGLKVLCRVPPPVCLPSVYNKGPQGSLPGTNPRVSTLRLQRRASRFFAGYQPPCVYPPSTTKGLKVLCRVPPPVCLPSVYNKGPQGSLPGTNPRVSTLRLQRRASRFFAGYQPPCVYPPSTTKGLKVLCRVPPPVCLPSVYLMLPFLYTQILGVTKGWGQC